MAENARRTLSAVNEELEPQSELAEEHINAGVDMPPTIRRNSGGGGAYTSYVFISNDQAGGGDDVGSVVSSTGSYGESGGDNRVTVNVKENTRSFEKGGYCGFLAKFSFIAIYCIYTVKLKTFSSRLFQIAMNSR